MVLKYIWKSDHTEMDHEPNQKYSTCKILNEIWKDCDFYPLDSVTCSVHNPSQHEDSDHFPLDSGTSWSPPHHVEKENDNHP